MGMGILQSGFRTPALYVFHDLNQRSIDILLLGDMGLSLKISRAKLSTSSHNQPHYRALANAASQQYAC
jgi:hypothetical protein